MKFNFQENIQVNCLDSFDSNLNLAIYISIKAKFALILYSNCNVVIMKTKTNYKLQRNSTVCTSKDKNKMVITGFETRFVL